MATADNTSLGEAIETKREANALMYSLLVGRLLLGWFFLQAGHRNAIARPEWFAGATKGIIGAGASNGVPVFSSFFGFILDTPWLLDLMTVLNAWAAILVGLALIAGAFLRAAAMGGAVMMVFYWAATYPFETSHVLNYNVFYALLFGILAIVGAGRVYGLDGYIEDRLPEKFSAARYFLG